MTKSRDLNSPDSWADTPGANARTLPATDRWSRAGKHSDQSAWGELQMQESFSLEKVWARPTGEPRVGQTLRLSPSQNHSHPHPHQSSRCPDHLLWHVRTTDQKPPGGKQALDSASTCIGQSVLSYNWGWILFEYILTHLDSLLTNTHELHNKLNILHSTRWVLGLPGEVYARKNRKVIAHYFWILQQ